MAHNILGWEAGSLIAGMLKTEGETESGLVSLNLRGNRIEVFLAACMRLYHVLTSYIVWTGCDFRGSVKKQHSCGAQLEKKQLKF